MLKLIGMILMLVDHIGMMFFEDIIGFRLIGRLAMPLFAYGIARGFEKTHSFKKYILRITGFAMISQVPYWMMFFAWDRYSFKWQQFNIGFTFLGALLCLVLYKRIREILADNNTINLLKVLEMVLESIIIMGILIAVTQLNCDYGAYGILVVWVFYAFYVSKKNEKMTLLMLIMVTFVLVLMGRSLQVTMQLGGGVLAFFIILGVQDKPFKNLKYLFYLFYPLHMLILAIIKLL